MSDVNNVKDYKSNNSLSDEQIYSVNGGDNHDGSDSDYSDHRTEITPALPGTNHPGGTNNPGSSGNPGNPGKPNKGIVCPKCGNFYMFEIVDGDKKHLRCTVCKTEFVRE